MLYSENRVMKEGVLLHVAVYRDKTVYLITKMIALLGNMD